MTLVPVYDAQSALDAAVVADVLVREGIEAQVFGAGLQGGVGELPAAGLVRVMVPDSQAARARELVRQWEQSQAEPEPTQRPVSHRVRTGLFQFASGIFAGIALTLLFAPQLTPGTPGNLDSGDRDGDGQADIWWHFSLDGELREQRLDRNLDGEEDAIFRFRDGREFKGSEDIDGDGQFESRWRMDYPHAVMEQDRNRDGVIEYRETYFHDLLARQEWFDEQGRLIKRANYDLGHLTSTELDLDGDGQVDRRTEYNWYAEPRS